MTIKEFVKEIEEYYGNQLNSSQKGYVTNYLSVYENKNLVKLLSVVMMYHSINFGTPGMATIEKAHKGYCEESETLKFVRTVSATAPVKEPEISEEEREEVTRMMNEEGGILSLIAKKENL